MRGRRIRVVVSMVALTGLAAVGCSSGDENTGASGTAGSPGAAAGEVKKVGLMVQDLSNPFFVSMQHGVEAKAKEIGATLSTQDGRQDLGTQNEQIDAFIQQRIDVLLLNAVDSKGIASAVVRAKAAGITVVAVDVAAEGASATITSNNVQAGTQACEYLATQIAKKGNILLVNGTPISSVQDRVRGCKQVLAKYPAIKIVGEQSGDNNRSKALTLATDMLTANPNVVGIFGINDPTALGATLAAEQAGKRGLVIVGVDGSPEAVKELKKPGTMFKGTPAQDPNLLGVTGLDMAMKLRKGEKLEQDTVLVPTKLITAQNVSTYKGWQ